MDKNNFMKEKESQFLRIENEKEKIESPEEISEIDKKMLLILNDLHSTFISKGIENYVVGGWAVEGYSGKKIDREHNDIDYLIWEKDSEKLRETLHQKHYKVIEGETDKKGKFYKFKHKLIAKKEGVDIDFGFIKLDKGTNEVFAFAYPRFRFPKEFLNGKEALFQIGQNQKSEFNIVSKELLVAMKINSKRKEDRKDIEFLKKEMRDEQILEIQKKYGLNYEDLKKREEYEWQKENKNKKKK